MLCVGKDALRLDGEEPVMTELALEQRKELGPAEYEEELTPEQREEVKVIKLELELEDELVPHARYDGVLEHPPNSDVFKFCKSCECEIVA